MNIHIGSWIVPTLFMIGFLLWTLAKVGGIKDKLTMAQAKIAAKWTPDDAVKAAVGFAMLCRWSCMSLMAWIIWAIVFLNFSH